MLVLFLLVILVTLYIINSTRKPPDFPPGPKWLPIIGNMQQLKKLSVALGGQHKALIELAKQYETNILGLKLGKDLVVVVFSYPIIRHVLKSEEYEGRPNNFFIKMRSMGNKKGITCADGKLWSTQRNFLVRHLRNLGFGKQAMETMVQKELDDVILLLNQNGAGTDIADILQYSVLNILWALTTGSHISRQESRLNNLINLLNTRTKVFDMSGGILSQLPWLRFVAPEITGFKLMTKLNEELKRFLMVTINEHYDTWTEGKNDDIIYSFITEMRKNESNGSTFTDEQLVMVCLDIFIAGAQTTSNTLAFAFLMMLLHSDVQMKVQEELDRVLDKNKTLEYSDRSRLPFVEAVLLEIERCYNVTPLSGPRRVLRDTELKGYWIPKDTTVLINNYSVHMDKQFWGDPEVFRPERFLDADGQLMTNERILTFGLGRRRCLGESLARCCMFLFFAGILREFNIEHVPGKPMPSGIPVSGITLSPEKYSANFLKRC